MNTQALNLFAGWVVCISFAYYLHIICILTNRNVAIDAQPLGGALAVIGVHLDQRVTGGAIEAGVGCTICDQKKKK